MRPLQRARIVGFALVLAAAPDVWIQSQAHAQATGRPGNPTQGIDPTIGAQSLDRGATGRPGNPTQGIDPTVGARSLDRGATGRAGNPTQGIDPTIGAQSLQSGPRAPGSFTTIPRRAERFPSLPPGPVYPATGGLKSPKKAGKLPSDLERCQANWDAGTKMSRASWNDACRRMLAAGRLGR